MRRNASAWFRLLGSLGLLAAVAWTVDLRGAAEAMGEVTTPACVALVALVQAQIWLSALRWAAIARRLGVPLALGRAGSEYTVSVALNQVLPGGVAGDAVRAWRHGRNLDPTAQAAWGPVVRAVMLERAAGQVAFVAIALAGVLLWPWLLPGSRPPATVTAVLSAAGVIVAVAVIVVVAGRAGPASWRRTIRALAPDARHAFLANGAWRWQAPLNLLIAGSFVAAFAVAAAAVGSALPPVAWLTVIPLTLLTMLIPISIGGWGVREGAAMALWPMVGAAPEAGAAAGAVYGLAVLAGSSPGFLIALGDRRHHAASRA